MLFSVNPRLVVVGSGAESPRVWGSEKRGGPITPSRVLASAASSSLSTHHFHPIDTMFSNKLITNFENDTLTTVSSPQ